MLIKQNIAVLIHNPVLMAYSVLLLSMPDRMAATITYKG